MKTVSVAACLGISLGAFLSLTNAGYTQAPNGDPCQSVDQEMTRAVAVTPKSLQAFQQASPEALQAFRELNRESPTGRIVGGKPVFVENNLWQVAMIRASVAEPRRSQFCGGSIIGNDWILTAAHCVRNSIARDDPARVDVIAGTPQFALGGERLKVAEIHVHPNFNQSTMDFDFALLRLSSPMTQGKAIALADGNTQVANGANTCVTGWGATLEGGPGSIDLLGARVPIVSTETCNRPESYNGDITANMICAGKEEGGVDSCQGDSGGPLSLQVGGNQTLIGVVSFGEGCARRLKYGIYSRVSVAAPWVASTTAQTSQARK
jgi:secreted trypsin-like serine protease